VEISALNLSHLSLSPHRFESCATYQGLIQSLDSIYHYDSFFSTPEIEFFTTSFNPFPCLIPIEKRSLRSFSSFSQCGDKINLGVLPLSTSLLFLQLLAQSFEECVVGIIVYPSRFLAAFIEATSTIITKVIALPPFPIGPLAAPVLQCCRWRGFC